MATSEALGSGLVGACALTLLHETARRAVPEAPRMDLLGMRAIRKTMQRVGRSPPHEDRLHTWSLVGDLASNSLYYSLVGLGRPEHALMRGALLGLAAGVGAVALPGPMGLGTRPSSRTRATKAMTIGWYTVGGLAAAMAFRLIHRAASR